MPTSWFTDRDGPSHALGRGADGDGPIQGLHGLPVPRLDLRAGRGVRYPLTELRTARRVTYDVAANWKCIVENFNECYHCGSVHPELCEVVPAFKRVGGADLDWDRGIPHREGATTFTFTGTTDRAPFPGLSEDERTRHKGELIYPNLLLSMSPDQSPCSRCGPRVPIGP